MESTISFSEIYTTYYKRSLLFVKSYVRDEAVSEDIASEALIQLWETMKKERVDSPLALLTVILKNRSLNYLKRQEIKLTAEESIASARLRDVNYRIMSLEACVPEEIYTHEITGIIRRTLASLPEQTRRVFEMSRYDNRPVREIAQELGISPKAVEYHITKALKVFRLALKDYLPLAILFIY